jgi:Flp pilus assembly protein TadD
MASKALQLDPQEGESNANLGMAHYRAGDWKAALAPLKKGLELRSDAEEDGGRFYLAMIQWQLGDKDQARKAYTQAVEWMDKNHADYPHLRCLRAEAAELLGVRDKKD